MHSGAPYFDIRDKENLENLSLQNGRSKKGGLAGTGKTSDRYHTTANLNFATSSLLSVLYVFEVSRAVGKVERIRT
jgi:putative IMPACT (imprinted ancient) family translation regulator